MTNLKVVPRYTGSNQFNERLNDCLWRLDHNNPERIKTKPQWKNEPVWFVYNVNYTDNPKYENQVIFSVGWLDEAYIKHFGVNPLEKPYWCGKVFYNECTGELEVELIKPWVYRSEIEGSKKKGWKVTTDLRYLFKVEVDLWNRD